MVRSIEQITLSHDPDAHAPDIRDKIPTPPKGLRVIRPPGQEVFPHEKGKGIAAITFSDNPNAHAEE